MGTALKSPLDWIDSELKLLEEGGLSRNLRLSASASLPEMEIDGRKVLQFSSNNYLGLSTHPEVIAAAKRALDTYGAGAGASRLISGTMAGHSLLEEKLAALKGTEAALVYATGSMANLGLLQALAGVGDLLLLDKGCHASLYDGARLSGAQIARFAHQDLRALERELGKSAKSAPRRLIIAVESLYSMDGDLAPLPELCALALRFGASLVVDEAHSTGVLGKQGRGAFEHFGMEVPEHVVIVGTLSKALGSLGGFVAGPKKLIRYLCNKSRAFIFATALAPASAAAAAAALDLLAADPKRRERLKSNCGFLKIGLQKLGWEVKVDGPIFPLIVGSAERALALQARLWEEGFYVPAIRPPTVPAGLCRLRLSLTSEHSPAQMEGLLRALGPC